MTRPEPIGVKSRLEGKVDQFYLRRWWKRERGSPPSSRGGKIRLAAGGRVSCAFSQRDNRQKCHRCGTELQRDEDKTSPVGFPWRKSRKPPPFSSAAAPQRRRNSPFTSSRRGGRINLELQRKIRNIYMGLFSLRSEESHTFLRTLRKPQPLKTAKKGEGLNRD